MKMKKSQMNLYAFHDFTGLTEHLEKMALRGWALRDIHDSVISFDRTSPLPRRYSIVYIQEDTSIEPLLEFCAEAGWHKAAQWRQMTIFFTDDPNAVPIDTDDAIQLETIRRVTDRYYAKRLKSLFWLFLLVAIPYGWLILSSPLDFLLNGHYLHLVATWLQYSLTLIIEAAAYFRWRKKTEKEGLCSTRGQKWIRATGFRLLHLTYWFWCLSLIGGDMQFLVLMMLAAVGLYRLLGWLTNHRLYRMGAATEVVDRTLRTVDKIGSGVIALILVVALLYAAVSWSQEVVYNANSNDELRLQHTDELPLTIEDLMEPDYHTYSTELLTRGFLVLRKTNATQTMLRGDEGHPELSYDIYDVRLPFLSQWMPELLEQDRSLLKGEFRPLDIPGLDASRCYDGDGDPMNTWLLCGENRFVILRPDWELTEEQLTAAAGILLP